MHIRRAVAAIRLATFVYILPRLKLLALANHASAMRAVLANYSKAQLGTYDVLNGNSYSNK